MYIYMTGMDMNTSTCIPRPGINMKMCKAAMDAVPNRFRHLFANSLFLGKFPTQWTNAYVTLLPKTGNKNMPGNWRPISQTIIFAKIIEKIVHKQLLNYFVENKILTELQYGFLPNKSTHEAVINVTRNMYSSNNNNKIMCMLFLDVAKASNCINHMLLFKKMRDVGMSERVISWFSTYLTKYQTVKYGEKMSTSMSIPAGIAQGTVLEPLIFIFFYINDCINTLNKVKISLFADDCVLYLTGNNWPAIREHFHHWN